MQKQSRYKPILAHRVKLKKCLGFRSFVYCYWKDGGTFGILFSTLNTKQTGRNNMITRKELAKAAKRTLKSISEYWLLPSGKASPSAKNSPVGKPPRPYRWRRPRRQCRTGRSHSVRCCHPRRQGALPCHRPAARVMRGNRSAGLLGGGHNAHRRARNKIVRRGGIGSAKSMLIVLSSLTASCQGP